MMDNITGRLKEHYINEFSQYGATSKGVDWGDNEENFLLRYEKMSNLILEKQEKTSLLDVGCGFGGFKIYLQKNHFDINYTGIDIASNMIEWANKNNAGDYIADDFLNNDFKNEYDYIICNGILTQKLEASNIDMDIYANKLIKKMFKLSKKGIAFNVMTTKVNFFSNNLYYRNPSELLAYCMSEISSKVKIDHSYLYEYTVYLYK